ncbi:WD40 repeat domain-containing serine/threonine protein kinase [Haloferula sp.]|uniref:WD40 repeat domain-containing serine/threonine protein kinase n=1 Tax=Haloferula sp. TaxID=2497595 RepID=UPI003C7534AC
MMKEARIFSEALDRSLGERGEYLREACGGDDSLRRKVEMLLSEHEEGSGLLDEPLEGLDQQLLSLGISGEHQPPSANSGMSDDGTRILYFGEYELQGEIARGAMGVVYRAYQTSLKRIVAVKMIRSNMLANEDDVARFRTEAEAAGSLDHPNIVPIYEVGEFEGQHYFSMKLIEGDTLREHLEDLQQNPRQTATLMAKVAAAIHAAHQRGTLHRDLKPSNILIDADGEPHVTDFGLAKQMESVSSATLSGQLIGTPSYMAPEQAENVKDVTTAADIYGLGAMFYELLTGVPPHRGDSIMETLKLISEQEPEPPSKHNPGVDRDLQTIAMKCLERDPAKRFLSARQLADDLERWLRGEPIHARPVGAAEWAVKWMKRKPAQATAALLGVLLLLMLGIGGPLVALRQTSLKNDAVKATDIAEQRAESLRKQMYAFEMIAASGEAATPDGIPKIERWIPEPDSELADLRGWEWYYARSVKDAPLAHYDTHRSSPAFAWSEKNGVLLLLDGSHTLSEWEFSTGRILNLGRMPAKVDSFETVPGTDEIKLFSGSKKMRKSLSSGEETVVFEIPHEDYSSAWSPTEDRLAFLSERSPELKNNSILRIWSQGEAWNEVPSVELNGASSSNIAWSHDGERFAIAIEPFGSLAIYHAATGKSEGIRNVTGRITGMQTLAWSPNGDLIAMVSEDGEIFVVRRDGLLPPEGWSTVSSSGSVNVLAWSPDGTRLVSGGDDRIVRVWDINTGKEVLSFRGHTDSITTLAWSPDGQWIASGQRGGMVRIWNAAEDSRPLRLQIEPPLSPNTLAWNPENDHIAIAANQEWAYTGVVLELPTRQIQNHPGFFVKNVAWNPDGTRLAAARLDGAGDHLEVWERSSGKRLWGEGPGSSQIAWAPDGKTLAAMVYEGDLLLYDGEDGSVLRMIKALSPDQRTERPTHQFRFSPDGATLAWGQAAGSLAFFDPGTGKLQRELQGHTARVNVVDWSRDGARIATASEDHTVRIWNVASGDTEVTMLGHSASVLDLRWSPDNTRLATASLDGTVRLWNPATGAEMARYACPAAMRSIDWSPDGTRLMAGGDDGIVLFDARRGFQVEAQARFQDHAKEGGWDAATDQAKQLLDRSSNKDQARWAQTGWWYRHGKESDTQPPNAPFDGKCSEWKQDEQNSSPSRIDLEGLLGECGDQPAWLTTRVFSPREQSIRLEVSGPGEVPVWQAMQQIQEADRITLQEGWNTFSLRLSDWNSGDLMNVTLLPE